MFPKRLLGFLVGAALLSSCGGTSGPPTPAPTPPLSYRPDAAGNQAQFTGTLTEADVNNVIASTPVSTTTTSTVADAVATGVDGQGNVTFTSTESDTAPLRTITTTTVATVAYQPQSGGAVDVRALKTVANDSNGVTYETDYGSNNGLLTVLPENAGSFTNDAAETYKETDPGQNVGSTGGQNVTTTRTVNPDGSYTQTTGTFDYNLQPVTNTAQEAADFSGTLALDNLPGTRLYTFSAPAGGAITFVYHNGATNKDSTSTVPDWIPAALAKPSAETDTIAAGSALDPSCKAGAAFPTTANKTTQTITAADAVLGTLETRTTTSYDVLGAGTICSTVTDAIQTFYDFSEQEGEVPRLIYASTGTALVPTETVTVTETLSLQSTNAPGAPGASSARRVPASVEAAGLIVPPALVSARAEHLVHQRALQRLAALRRLGGLSK